jgi:hypothetical protein
MTSEPSMTLITALKRDRNYVSWPMIFSRHSIAIRTLYDLLRRIGIPSNHVLRNPCECVCNKSRIIERTYMESDTQYFHEKVHSHINFQSDQRILTTSLNQQRNKQKRRRTLFLVILH